MEKLPYPSSVNKEQIQSFGCEEATHSHEIYSLSPTGGKQSCQVRWVNPHMRVDRCVCACQGTHSLAEWKTLPLNQP